MSSPVRSRRVPAAEAQVLPLHPATRLLPANALAAEQLLREAQDTLARAQAESERLVAAAKDAGARLLAQAEELADQHLRDAQARVLELEGAAEQRGRSEGRERMHALLHELGSELRRHNDGYARDVAGAACDVAQAVLDVELSLSPERIARIVRRAVLRIRPNTDIVVRLSSRDAEFVRPGLAELEQSVGVAIGLRTDADAGPGSVCIETPRGSYQAAIAAQLEGLRRRIAGMQRGDS